MLFGLCIFTAAVDTCDKLLKKHEKGVTSIYSWMILDNMDRIIQNYANILNRQEKDSPGGRLKVPACCSLCTPVYYSA